MKTHHTLLKQAVTTALTILGLGAPVSASAIELGDISVNSYLGQSLRATIKIPSLNGLKDVDCIRLGADAGSINAISQADLKLSHVQNDHYQRCNFRAYH